MAFLREVFPDAVLEPIRLHVDTKRYRSAIEPAYWDRLSTASKRSLTLQGGRLDDAVMLRRWDDLAKVPARPTRGLGHFIRVLHRSAI